jgi:hypothetical protein
MSKVMQASLLLGNLQAENPAIPSKKIGWVWAQIIKGLEHSHVLQAERGWIKLQELLWRHQQVRTISKSELELNKIITDLDRDTYITEQDFRVELGNDGCVTKIVPPEN